MKRFTFFALVLSISTHSLAQENVATSNAFYKDKERGWFWFEDPEKEMEEKQQAPPPPQARQPAPKTIPLDAKWLRANLEKLTLKAMSNPTEANLANYAFAQRLMLDMSSRFSSKMTDYMMDQPLLDETSRRPTDAFSLREFKSEKNDLVKNVIDEINAKTKGLWFFYSSTCSYCVKMVPVMKRFKHNYGMDILAISLDGGILPGMEDFEIVVDRDNAVASRFGVTHTPTTYLVMNDNTPELVAKGMKSLTELEAKVIRSAKLRNIISKEQYAKTKSVYELNMYNNESGQLYVNEEMLEKDPNYLSEALKKQLGDVQPYGTRLINQPTPNRQQ